MNVEPYTLDHYREMTGEQENLGMAALNQISGPGFALIDGGQVIAVGGVRVQGIGQAWALLSPTILKQRKALLRTARDVVEQCIAHEKLYRVYAEASVDKPAFYKHLGFKQQDNLWVR
jgi:hypothetical protein